METVIKPNGIDNEALMSFRNPLAPPGAQLGESGSSQVAGSLMSTRVTKDPKANQAGNEISKPDSYPTGKLIVGPSSGRLEAYQVSPSNVPGTMFFIENFLVLMQLVLWGCTCYFLIIKIFLLKKRPKLVV